MNSYKISVLTPCWNAKKYLERAVNSVCIQDYSNWEHIVVDAGSTDGTLEVLNRHGHLKWISEPDRGQSDAMNKAFLLAEGQVVVYLNADDEFLPGAFTEIVQRFKQNPGCNLVLGGFEMVTERECLTLHPQMTARTLVQECGYWPYNPVCYFYDRSLQEQIGPFPLENHFTMDYWWLLRALKRARVVHTKRILGRFHNLDGNKTSDLDRALAAKKQVLDEFIFSRAGFKYAFWYGRRYLNHWRWYKRV